MGTALLIIAAAFFLGLFATTKLWKFALQHLHLTEVAPGANLPLSQETFHATVLRIREDIAGIGVCASVTNGLLAAILATLILQLR
jgi:hypothetical protein